MNSFKKKDVELPLGPVWLMNAIAEYKGKQELYTRQSPQILKLLIEAAIGSQLTAFSMADIERTCVGVSRPMIRVVLENLRDQGKVEVVGSGRSAKWRKRDTNKKRDSKRDNKSSGKM